MKADKNLWTSDGEGYRKHGCNAAAKPTTDAPHSETGKSSQLFATSAQTLVVKPSATASVATTTNSVPQFAIATRVSPAPASTAATRPQYYSATLPYVSVTPAPLIADPIRSGNFLLWPDPDPATTGPQPKENDGTPIVPPPRRPIFLKQSTTKFFGAASIALRQAWFASSLPTLVDFSLTAQVTVQSDRSLRVTGGTAILSLNVYGQLDEAALESYRTEWTDALTLAGRGDRVWKFEPQVLRNLEASLDLPAGHLARPPQISVSPGSGAVTFVIELTEEGAIVWKSALEQRNGSAIPGIARINTTYYTQAYAGADVRPQKLSAPLGFLLASQGREKLRIINPQQTVTAKLIVVGNDLVDHVVVNMVPSHGQAPEQQVFGPDGGQVDLSITTQAPDAEYVDWSTQVSFKPTGWPSIPDSGRMSSAGGGWAQLEKPDSWIANYSIMALLVNDAGQPLPLSAAGSNYHVNGVLTFTASYIPVTGILTTAFELAHQSFVNIMLPRFPDQPFGDLVLTMFSTRDGIAGTQTRRLLHTELGVVVTIKPNAQITISTTTDRLPELSGVATMLEVLGRMK